MIAKKLLRPDRLRKIPPRFSWLDQRLVRDNHLARCDPTALALYLFLVTVADAQGLSFYSDASIGRHLAIDNGVLARARRQLQQAQLIAYDKPLYQVLALDPPTLPQTPARRNGCGQIESVGQILQHLLGEKS